MNLYLNGATNLQPKIIIVPARNVHENTNSILNCCFSKKKLHFGRSNVGVNK